MIEIGGIQKTTLIDYPGRLAATIFLLGCNFRCPFCYSSELVFPEKISKQPRIDLKEFFDFLEERRGLLEGVVVCGGEPTTQEDLPEFVGKIKKLGFLVKLDTNGSNPSMLKRLLQKKLIDYVAMDIKAPREKYSAVVGVDIDIDKIEESIELLKGGGTEYEFRTTVVPIIHSREDILAIAKWIGPAKKLFLQNFLPEKTVNPSFEKIKPYQKEFLMELKKEISSFFNVCDVRG